MVPVALALACAALAFALHRPALEFEFVNWDDWEYVLYNPALRAPGPELVRYSTTAFVAGNWHPLTLLSYGLDFSLYGEEARGYHATNLWLHALNTGLVVALAGALLGAAMGARPERWLGAAFVGAVFATHPVHVESVAWVSERKDLLYSLFWLLSCLFWLRYAAAEETAPGRSAAWTVSLVAFLFSALSKPMAVTLPLVLLLFDVYPLRRFEPQPRRVLALLVEKWPFFAIALIVGLATLFAQGERGALGKADLDLLERIEVALLALGFYVKTWIAPVTLTPLHPIEVVRAGAERADLAGLAALGGLFVVGVLQRRRWPALWPVLTGFVVMLLPVLGLIEIGHQRAADRYLYLPMLAPTLLLGSGVAWAGRTPSALRGARAFVTGVAAVGLVFWVAWLGARTVEQLPVWRSSTSLWQHVLSVYPNSWLANYNLAQALAVEGNDVRAEAAWKLSLAIRPDHAPTLYELGAAAGRRVAYREARHYFERALEVDPNHARARLNLAMLLENVGEPVRAIAQYRAFLRRVPNADAEQLAFVHARIEALEAKPR